MKHTLLSTLTTLFAIAIASTGQTVTASTAADSIYLGGTVLTMNDASPRAEAVAVRQGRILAVGTADAVNAHRGDGTRVVDLDGRALLPGFVDSHGHVTMGGMQSLSANLLAPPDGEVTDIASLQDTLRQWMKDNKEFLDAHGVIIGFGYDQSQLAEQRHPTRADLDAVSTQYPMVLFHQSGHFGAMNSPGLELAGISRTTPNPDGGIIRRDEQGKPDGVLEENALFVALNRVFALLGEQGLLEFAQAGPAMWARYGYTTAQEGRATPDVVKTMEGVAAEGGYNIDVVAYVDILVDRDFVQSNASAQYRNRLRVGGAKLTIDGSPQGFTAWRDQPYYDPVGDYPQDYAGYASASERQVLDSISWAMGNNIQILTHANGEAASDLLLRAVAEATERHGKGDRRPVLIHGQFLREDQVDRLQQLDIFPSLFPMHTFYWGDWHRDHTVGPALADNISPTGWLRERDMIFGTHHDAPVALPNSLRVLDATVTRRTRSGDILGPTQRVDVMTALKAMTIWPAWQHFEEENKGSIEVGKLADFVILSQDPTAIDPETLDSLEVIATIKEDSVIYASGDNALSF